MWTEEYDNLCAEADALTPGSTQISLYEQAVRLAQTHQDDKREFDANLELMAAVTFGGQPEKMLVVFPKLIAKCDEDPEKYRVSSVLWTYKWVMENLPDFSALSKEQILRSMDDMEARFRKENFKERTIYEFRRILAVKMGEPARAESYQEKFDEAPETTILDRWLGVANCEACELNNQLDYFLFAGMEQKAIDMAEPILAGKMSCGEVPHNTYPKLLWPLVRANQETDAVWYYKKAVPLIRNDRKLLSEHAHLITFATLTKNLSEAIHHLEQNFEAAFSTYNQAGKLDFYTAAMILMEGLIQEGRPTQKLRLPEKFARHQTDGVYQCASLRDEFKALAEKLSADFDARNGNTFYWERLQAVPQLISEARHIPLG